MTVTTPFPQLTAGETETDAAAERGGVGGGLIGGGREVLRHAVGRVLVVDESRRVAQLAVAVRVVGAQVGDHGA